MLFLELDFCVGETRQCVGTTSRSGPDVFDYAAISRKNREPLETRPNKFGVYLAAFPKKCKLKI
jgi:hypothetical protein